MTQPKPTFHEVRKQHNITLNMLIEDAQVDPSAVLLLDTWSIGEAGIINTLLASLSRLCGITGSPLSGHWVLDGCTTT